MLDNLRKLVWYDKKDVLSLLDGKDFSSEQEMEDYLLPKLPKLFRVPEQNVKRQYELTNFTGKRSSRCDVAVLSKWHKDKVVLVIELKLEKSLKEHFPGLRDGLTDGMKELANYCQSARSSYGMLLTDKQCFLREYSYGKSSRIQKFYRLKLLFFLDTLDPMPMWRLMVINMLVALNIWLLYVLYHLVF